MIFEAPSNAVVEFGGRRIDVRITNMIGPRIWAEADPKDAFDRREVVRLVFPGDRGAIGFEAFVSEVKGNRISFELASASDPRVRAILSRWSAGMDASFASLAAISSSEATTLDLRPSAHEPSIEAPVEDTDDIRPMRSKR